MWNLDLYARLDLADAWIIIGPINWYAPSSSLKLMFDRLVCMSGGNPQEALIDHKNPEKAMQLEKSPQWKALSVNHLEGRTGAFFCYGDDGADETGEDGRPKALIHKEWLDPGSWSMGRDRDAYLPLVLQCRYSGIEVPEELWTAAHTGVGLPYGSDQSEQMVRDGDFMGTFEAWVQRVAAFIATKGKVEAGRFRAFGYHPPRHRLC